MPDTTKQFKQQLPKNTLMAVLSFITYSLSAIWLTPYLVKHLGAAAYGLVPLAGLFTQYISIITTQISNAVNRFLTIEIQKLGGKPNVIFNSAFALYLLLILFQLPLIALGLFYVDWIFDIPPALKTDALLLLGCSAGGFLIALLGGVFGVSQFSKNRIDISSSINLGRLIMRLSFIVICFTIWGPKLRFIGYVDIALHVVTFYISVWMWKRLTPELYISFRKIDWRILSPIFHMSLWTLFNNLGSLLYLRTDIWIINRFISPIAAGQYAAVLVISNFIRQLAQLCKTQLDPIVMIYWAKGEIESLRRLLELAMKVLTFGLAIPIAWFCINSKIILELWLGKSFSELSPLLIVMVLHLVFSGGVYPLFTLQRASNSLRWPSVVTFLMGITNVGLSYYLGVIEEMGMMGVAISTAFVLTFQHALFTPIYGAYILKSSYISFITPLLTGLVSIGVVLLASTIPVAKMLGIERTDWPVLILQACFISLVMGLAGWFLLLTKQEKRSFIDVFRPIPRRLFNYM